MSDGFPNKPKILRGAFVEYGLSIPPLFVVFQFNPIQLTRNRSLSFSGPNPQFVCPPCEEDKGKPRIFNQQSSLRNFHNQDFKDRDDLLAIQEKQQVDVQEESISLDIRLDATDDLDKDDLIAREFGILPRLSTLELMVHPKEESLLGGAVDSLLSLDGSGFSFTKKKNPPMILFIWGYTRVLPVNINSMNVTETEFNTILSPTRATVAVSMTVIEGKSIPYMYSKLAKEAMSALNLANIADIADVVVPG